MEAGCVMSSIIRVKTKPRIQVDFQEMEMGASVEDAAGLEQTAWSR